MPASPAIRPSNTSYCAQIAPWTTPLHEGIIEGGVRVREGGLATEVKRDWMLVRRGGAEMAVLPGEIRQRVHGPAEATVRLAGRRAQEG